MTADGNSTSADIAYITSSSTLSVGFPTQFTKPINQIALEKSVNSFSSGAAGGNNKDWYLDGTVLKLRFEQFGQSY